MGEPLKRTFYGCLTCRRRKVRCGGGSPCQNCSRMNVTCHSSFETNFRVSVVSPSGQHEEALDHSQAGRVTSSALAQGTRPASPFISPEPVLSRDDDELYESIANDPSFALQMPLSTHISPLPSHDQLDSLLLNTIPDFNPLESFGSGGGLDFEFSLDFPLQPFFTQPVVSTNVPEEDNIPRESTLTQLDLLHHNSTDLSDSSGRASQARKGPTKEWTPRRKRRKQPTINLKNTSQAQGRTEEPQQQPPSSADGRQSDATYLRYYSNCIRENFTLKDDANWSYHRYIHDLIQDTSSLCPTRLSVLAWVAKHLSCASKSPENDAWKTYYSLAEAETAKMLQRCWIDWTLPGVPGKDMGSISTVAELQLCSALFLCRCDVLNDDIATASRRLESIRQGLETHSYPLRLSAIASKMLLWLCYMDVRINIFATPKVGSGMLLETVRRRLDYGDIVARSHLYLSETYGDGYPAEDAVQDAEMMPVWTRTCETFCLISDILQYRSWSLSTEAEHAGLRRGKIEAIESDMRSVEGEFTLAMMTSQSAGILRLCSTTPVSSSTARQHRRSSARMSSTQPSDSSPPLAFPRAVHTTAHTLDATLPAVSLPLRPWPPGKPTPLTRVTRHWLSSYAAFQTAKILWSRTLFPSIRTDADSTAAVHAILQISIHLRRATTTATDDNNSSSPSSSSSSRAPNNKNNKILRSTLWPLPVFMAGIETTDEVYADYVRVFVAEVTGDATSGGGLPGGGGGDGAKRVLELMARVRERQDELGRRVSVEDVVGEMAPASCGSGEGLFVF